MNVYISVKLKHKFTDKFAEIASNLSHPTLSIPLRLRKPKIVPQTDYTIAPHLPAVRIIQWGSVVTALKYGFMTNSVGQWEWQRITAWSWHLPAFGTVKRELMVYDRRNPLLYVQTNWIVKACCTLTSRFHFPLAVKCDEWLKCPKVPNEIREMLQKLQKSWGIKSPFTCFVQVRSQLWSMFCINPFSSTVTEVLGHLSHFTAREGGCPRVIIVLPQHTYQAKIAFVSSKGSPTTP